jgi:hypothetical protein
MTKDTEPRVTTESGATRATRLLLVVLGVATLVCIAVLVALALQGMDARALQIEIAKVALQVVAVAVIGTLLTFLLKLREELRADAQRELDELHSQRNRQDERLTAALNDIVVGYNQVKRIRRSVRAGDDQEAGGAGSGRPPWLVELDDQQLEFERLLRIAPLIDDILASRSIQGIDGPLRQVEDFLRGITKIGNVPSPQDLQTASFREGVSVHIDDMVERLTSALLTTGRSIEPRPTGGEAHSARPYSRAERSS